MLDIVRVGGLAGHLQVGGHVALGLSDDDIVGSLAVELDPVGGMAVVGDPGAAVLGGEVGGEGGLCDAVVIRMSDHLKGKPWVNTRQ